MARPNFEALRDLHNSANELLHSHFIQQALVQHGQEKWVHQVSEASLRLLDVCGISKEVVSAVKEHVQDLQLMLRRVSSCTSTTGPEADQIDTKIASYINCYRNKLKKEELKCLNILKGIKRKSSSMVSDSEDELALSSNVYINIIDDQYNLRVAVDQVLRQVRVATVSIVETLLSLISIPWLDNRKSATTATSNFKFINIKSKFMCASGRTTRVYDICDVMALQTANIKRLDAVQIAIQDLHVELECMFRRLIQTRVALLNILTN